MTACCLCGHHQTPHHPVFVLWLKSKSKWQPLTIVSTFMKQSFGNMQGRVSLMCLCACVLWLQVRVEEAGLTLPVQQ